MTISPALSLRDRIAELVDDAHLLAGQREADRAGLADAVVGVERRGARTLGEPVAFDERDAEDVLDAGDQLGGHRGRAAHDEPQR